jgi:hypothetical protein
VRAFFRRTQLAAINFREPAPSAFSPPLATTEYEQKAAEAQLDYLQATKAHEATLAEIRAAASGGLCVGSVLCFASEGTQSEGAMCSEQAP